jgi:hypothetical protein
VLSFAVEEIAMTAKLITVAFATALLTSLLMMALF